MTTSFMTPFTYASLRPSSLALILFSVYAFGLGGCAMMQEDKIDYSSAKRANTLEVPPDLTQLSKDQRFSAPHSVVTASGYQQTQPAVRVAAPDGVKDVRLERAGTQRWLVVKRPPEKLWEPVRDFWQENGFILTLDQENLGLMETDWAENRAKIPQDFIRNTLGKVLDSLYSTGERDRFRTRMERNESGDTEIFVSHRGMLEVFADSQKDRTVWQPRPSDAELEVEFLRRLMVKLGVTPEQSKQIVSTASQLPKARLIELSGQDARIELDETFDRAWRRIGLSLDRSGFTVEDRDRSKGVYYVRYVEPIADSKDPGFLARMLGRSKKEAQPAQYQIQVKTSGNLTALTVLASKGENTSVAATQRMLKLLADDLR
jgi:outer membrane protein assembly factor BamC